MIVKKTKYGLYIEGKILLKIRADIDKNKYKEGDLINDEEALELLEINKDELASSNDGSEMIANAEIILD